MRVGAGGRGTALVAAGAGLAVLVGAGLIWGWTRTGGGPGSGAGALPAGSAGLAVAGPAASTATAGPSPSPKPTAKPSPSPTPRRSKNGFPDASTTGVPPGTKLRDVGELTITKAGSTITGVRAKCIIIRASNVTVRRSLVRGGSCGSARQVEVAENVRNALLEDVEIDGAHVHARGAGLGGSHFTCRRCDIHGMARGIQPNYDAVIEDSYVHDLYGTSISENLAFSSNGGGRYVIRGNNLEMNDVPTGGMALGLIGDWGPIDDVLVENNLFNGGGYAVWGGDPGETTDKNPDYYARNVRFLNNAFGRKFFKKCGYYGPVAAFDTKAKGNRWSGNYWLDTRKPVPP
ncbi:right-handed parallel beta-helix repeat-containing protein [Rhizomonospora bruguierae]|uniref:hypothetical protein n=1 Tax=Rhizomonospora bruguierae TaxID=1581705 RepID=UPI001BCBDCB8|nr:hypothetical protein [Micromonospora sp. NBRC 107566]